MNAERTPKNLLLVGAGGIGTQLLELLVAALRKVNLNGTITVMDGAATRSPAVATWWVLLLPLLAGASW